MSWPHIVIVRYTLTVMDIMFLQIDFIYYVNTDLLIAFSCEQRVSYRYILPPYRIYLRKPCFVYCHQWYGSCLDVNRYKYKFLRATTSNIPSSVIKDNRGTKLTIGRGGMLKVQHLVSVAKSSLSHPHIDSAGYQQPSRIAFIEFFVKPEVDEDNTDD